MYSIRDCFLALEDVADDVTSSQYEICGHDLTLSCSRLSHAIEMLSKSLLERKSPYLLLNDLKFFDKDIPHVEKYYREAINTKDLKYCCARVALNRASKILKKKLKTEDFHALQKIISNRNMFEHRDDAHLVSYDEIIDEILKGVTAFTHIYESEYREGNLFKDIKKITGAGSLEPIYKKLNKYNSDQMKKMLKEKKKRAQNGTTYHLCPSCGYEFMEELSLTARECTWCGHSIELTKCSIDGCENEVWSIDGNTALCRQHRLSQRTRDILSSQADLLSKLNLDPLGGFRKNIENLTKTPLSSAFEGFNKKMSIWDSLAQKSTLDSFSEDD